MVDAAIIPPNETERMRALQRYRILDTPPDGTFDRITALISQLLDVPIAIVSLVDADRIWFKSHHGVDVEQIDREPGLCASAILGDGPYVINDTRVDPRSLTNPLVAGDFGLRFYAAVPLRTHDGFSLGTLCCLDFKPRELSAKEAEVLACLGQVVMDQMELRLSAREVDVLHQNLKELNEKLHEQASHDTLTGLWNRHAIMEVFAQALSRSRRDQRPLSVMMIDIDFFKKVNDNFGHPAGDKVLLVVAQRLKKALRESDSVGRMGGEEFLCILDPCNAEQARIVAERCREAVCKDPIAVGPAGQETCLSVTVSIGVFSTDGCLGMKSEDIVRRADEALYRSKHAGRNRVTADTF